MTLDTRPEPMTTSFPDLFAPQALTAYGKSLRAGTASSAHETARLLDRITRADSRSAAFTHVASDAALAAAKGVDELLRARVDLGPLMGVPIAVKDLYAV